MIFALSVVATFAVVGSAIDYGMALSRRDAAANALDNAVVMAAVEIKASASTNDGEARDGLAKRVVREFIDTSDVADLIDDPVVKLSETGLDVTVSATATGSTETTMLGFWGISKIDFTVKSASVATISPFIDVTLLVDTSGSMALGATSGDIQKLSARYGCAFACHDNPGKDSFAWAAANGVKLRYDLIREAVMNFADHVDSVNQSNRIRVQVYTFDDQLRLNQSLTSNMDRVRAKLPSAPQTSSETVGGTRWWTFASSIPGIVGTGGDGSKRSKAIKLVMMLTDGVQDPNRTWTWDLPLRNYVREFDWAACDSLRDNNVKVGVVQVPYLQMNWDWGYVATLGQPSLLGRGGDRLADTTYALQRCGGDLYHRADTPDSVTESFKTLFRRAAPPRLSS